MSLPLIFFYYFYYPFFAAPFFAKCFYIAKIFCSSSKNTQFVNKFVNFDTLEDKKIAIDENCSRSGFVIADKLMKNLPL